MVKPVKVFKYGKWVWCNEVTEDLRGEQCLCLNCGFNCGLMNNDGCDIANRLYEICKTQDIALIVTRCPVWEGE